MKASRLEVCCYALVAMLPGAAHHFVPRLGLLANHVLKVGVAPLPDIVEELRAGLEQHVPAESIGHWEGDTLVVDVVGQNDLPWLDSAGHPKTEQIHVVERWHRGNREILHYESHHRYGDDAVQRLRFIRRCRDLGFTLDQVRDLLRLSSEKTKACEEVKRIAAQHRKAVEEKLGDLKRLSKELRRIDDCCRGKGVIADCQIIEALSSSQRVAAQGKVVFHRSNR